MWVTRLLRGMGESPHIIFKRYIRICLFFHQICYKIEHLQGLILGPENAHVITRNICSVQGQHGLPWVTQQVGIAFPVNH